MKKKHSGGRFHSCHSGEHLLWNSHALWNGKAATGRVSPQRQGTGGQQKKRLSPLRLLVHDSHDDQFHWRPHASLYLSRVLLLCNNRHSRWASCPQTMSERSCSGWEQKSRTDLPSQNQTTVSGKANKPEETYILFLILVFHSTQGATRCGCFRAVVLTEDWLSLAPTGKPLLYQVAMETGSRLGDGGKQRKEGGGVVSVSLGGAEMFEKRGWLHPSLSPQMLSVCPSRRTSLLQCQRFSPKAPNAADAFTASNLPLKCYFFADPVWICSSLLGKTCLKVWIFMYEMFWKVWAKQKPHLFTPQGPEQPWWLTCHRLWMKVRIHNCVRLFMMFIPKKNTKIIHWKRRKMLFQGKNWSYEKA